MGFPDLPPTPPTAVRSFRPTGRAARGYRAHPGRRRRRTPAEYPRSIWFLANRQPRHHPQRRKAQARLPWPARATWRRPGPRRPASAAKSRPHGRSVPGESRVASSSRWSSAQRRSCRRRSLASASIVRERTSAVCSLRVFRRNCTITLRSAIVLATAQWRPAPSAPKWRRTWSHARRLRRRSATAPRRSQPELTIPRSSALSSFSQVSASSSSRVGFWLSITRNSTAVVTLAAWSARCRPRTASTKSSVDFPHRFTGDNTARIQASRRRRPVRRRAAPKGPWRPFARASGRRTAG